MPSIRMLLRRPSAPRCFAAVLAFGVASALSSAPASAQPAAGLAQLRQIFSEGRSLEDKGSWAEALEKFKEVAAAKMTPQVRFHIALCEEHLGKVVSAIRGFELAAAEGTAAGSAAVEVPPAAKQHAEALRARVAKIRITVNGKGASTKVLLDDNALGEKELDSDVEVDPGAHVVDVRDASGKSAFHKELTLAEKGSEKIEVTLEEPGEVKAPPPPAPPPAPSRVPAYVVGGFGLAALATSGAFFALRSSNIATVASHCADMVSYTGCSPQDQDLANQGKLYNNLADAMLGVGLAGVATGTVLFFVLAPKKPASAAAPPPAASMWVVPAGTGFKLIGAF